MTRTGTSRRSWFWAGGALLLSLVVLAGLGVASVRWEARARAEEQRSMAQRAAEQWVEAMWEKLKEGSEAEKLAEGIEGGESWLPEPGEEDEAFRRYLAGDYEWVLGAGRGHRTPAGLPVQSLAALQLMRTETERARLAELCEVVWAAGGYLLPSVMEEGEARHRSLGYPLPEVLQGWRERWEARQAGRELSEEADLRVADLDRGRGRWVNSRRGEVWVGRAPDGGKILALSASGVARAAMEAGARIPGLPGTEANIWLSGSGVIERSPVTRTLVQAGNEVAVSIVVIDEDALGRSDRSRGLVLGGAIATAIAAGLLGLWLAYGAYRRERVFAQRQGDFIAAVSHEMRTPLASMRLLAGNLERDVLERPEEKKEHAHLIMQEMERLSRMVERVLSFAQQEAGNGPGAMEEIDPEGLLERAGGAVRPLAEKREVVIEMEVERFSALPRGDPDVLMEAVVNLLDNAVKHSPAPGVVRVGARSQNESWCLWVEDEGEGVPERERERIFEQFYRVGPELRRERPGSGLGLALVRQTAERHGGTVRCLGAKGGGARFEMVLPLHGGAGEKGAGS